MKAPITLLCLLCFCLPVPHARATSLIGDSLNVGNSNDVTSHVTLGAVIGESNSVQVDGWGTMMIGDSNAMDRAYSSLTIGSANSGNIDTSFCVGWYNEMGGMLSLVGGEFNSAGTTDGIVFGLNNVIDGTLQFALGRGLINADWWDKPSVFLGQYNKFDVSNDPPPLLTIGNGTGPAANQRSNALEVYLDGKIKIPKRQGDIVMGEFGNGNGD